MAIPTLNTVEGIFVPAIVRQESFFKDKKGVTNGDSGGWSRSGRNQRTA